MQVNHRHPFNLRSTGLCSDLTELGKKIQPIAIGKVYNPRAYYKRPEYTQKPTFHHTVLAADVIKKEKKMK